MDKGRTLYLQMMSFDSSKCIKDHTFISISASTRGNTVLPTWTGDPALDTSPTECNWPSFPRLIFRVLRSVLSLLHSKSLGDGDVKFCCP